jgi:GH18 family chitinase
MVSYEAKKLAANSFLHSQGWNSFEQYPRQMADVNGDGRADIIGFGYDNVVVALGQTDGTFTSTITAKNDHFTTSQGGWDSFDRYPRQVADVNGDNRADIVGFGYDNVVVSLGQTDGTFGSTIIAKNDHFTESQGGWNSFDRYPRQVADVNGDNRADIIGFGYDNVVVSLGQTDGTFGSTIIAKNDHFTESQGGWNSFDRYPRQVADVNGDNRADIIGFGYDNVVVALGQSDGTFGSTIIAKNDAFTESQGGWNSFDKYPRQVRDVNNDGRADIIGFSDNDVVVALGQSDGTFGSTTVVKNDDFTINQGGWNTFDGYPRQVADVNGDGSGDIVGFKEDGAYVSLASDGSGGVTPPPQTDGNIVGGYVGSWDINENTKPNIIATADKLTHLFYAFADVTAEGEVRLKNNREGDISFLQSIKAQNPNLKIIVSIGGAKDEGGYDESLDFSSVASDPQKLANFTQSTVDFMQNNGFDGIDIDWEFPKKEENNDYLQMLGDLRQAVDSASVADGKNYELSTALSASPYTLSPSDYGVNPYDFNPTFLKTTSEYVDFINVMSYDYHIPTQQGELKMANHQAALYANPNDTYYNSSKLNVSWGIEQYLNAGVEAEDIVLGAPLYSWRWDEVNPGANNDGLFETGTPVEEAILYKDLYNKLDTDSNYQRYWDDSAKVPYVYNSQTQEFSTYEDKQSILGKIDYIEQQELGGMFFWQIGGDLPISSPDSLINVAASNLLE